eukprot:GHVP01000408.1.p1 GENE.GHVP01000408.1~~GHVP01000408.1.p1  ORF type:complete len:338 (+),score=52.24 GHVP01000408.1:758-1771(+)
MSFHNINQVDTEILPAMNDTVSELSSSSTSDLLAASTWSGLLRVYEVNQAGGSVQRIEQAYSQPVLTCQFSPDGSKIASAGAEKTVKLIDIATSQTHEIPEGHTSPIRCLKWFDSNIIITGGWDRSIRYWDLRTNGKIGEVALPDRCYAMDTKNGLFAVATAERHICLFNMQDPFKIYKQTESPLKWQTKSISCFNNGRGYIIGSIEGRCQIVDIDPNSPSSNTYPFRCHRIVNDVYPVNSIITVPGRDGIALTGGADGSIGVWNYSTRTKIKELKGLNYPVTSMCFNKSVEKLFYTTGYDWSKGYEGSKDIPTKIFARSTADLFSKAMSPSGFSFK